MFTEIQFCEVKQHIDEQGRVDVSRTLDQSVLNTLPLDQIEQVITENLVLQLLIASSYYYFKNCSIDIASILPNQDVDQAMIPLLFKKTLVNYDEHGDVVSFQTEGITPLCKDVFDRLICNGAISQVVKTLFYDGKLLSDVQKTSCYQYQLSEQTEHCAVQDQSIWADGEKSRNQSPIVSFYVQQTARQCV